MQRLKRLTMSEQSFFVVCRGMARPYFRHVLENLFVCTGHLIAASKISFTLTSHTSIVLLSILVISQSYYHEPVRWSS
jgi:arginine exporter protein ArgO